MKMLFPFWSQEKYGHLLSKAWFKILLLAFPVLVLASTSFITYQFAQNSYLYCYEELQTKQGEMTSEAAQRISRLDFSNPSAKLEALKIQNENNRWFTNKINECRELVEKNRGHLFLAGTASLIISFYLVQFILFLIIRKKTRS